MTTYLIMCVFQSNMDNDSETPVDTLNTDVLEWAKSIGSKAKTVTDVISSRDPLVS